jgi:hypothetical protein
MLVYLAAPGKRGMLFHTTQGCAGFRHGFNLWYVLTQAMPIFCRINKVICGGILWGLISHEIGSSIWTV